jgi:hypothetical protein
MPSTVFGVPEEVTSLKTWGSGSMDKDKYKASTLAVLVK